MEEIIQFLAGILNREFIRAVFSNPRVKDNVVKAKLRPMEQKGELLFQLESFTKTQAFHKNLTVEETKNELAKLLEEFRQVQVETVIEDITVLISKKGKATIKRKRKKVQAKAADLSHNRKKKYILEEGIVVPFLQDLGVIIDFGCGKSYLTFAMYYYLHELKGYDIRIIGLDLKTDVILHCNELAKKYGYEKLTFLVGDIADYEGVDQVDMVVTLHACDTATDYALAKAVGWNAKVILSVPCCQHEVNKQLEKQRNLHSGKMKSKTEVMGVSEMLGDQLASMEEVLGPIMDYGLLRERFAALVTDGLRAKRLESEGYETQVLEFIDMEHTPKNILLRAVKKGSPAAKSRKEAEDCERFLKIQPTLGMLLAEQKGDK